VALIRPRKRYRYGMTEPEMWQIIRPSLGAEATGLPVRLGAHDGIICAIWRVTGWEASSCWRAQTSSRTNPPNTGAVDQKPLARSRDASVHVMPFVSDLQSTPSISVSWPTLRIGALGSQFWMHPAPRLGTGTSQSVTLPSL
jgi:hypothetical protein